MIYILKFIMKIGLINKLDQIQNSFFRLFFGLFFGFILVIDHLLKNLFPYLN